MAFGKSFFQQAFEGLLCPVCLAGQEVRDTEVIGGALHAITVSPVECVAPLCAWSGPGEKVLSEGNGGH